MRDPEDLGESSPSGAAPVPLGLPPAGAEDRLVSVPDLVQRVVAEVAPADLAVLEEVAQAWLDGQLPHQRGRRSRFGDGAMRIGVVVPLDSGVVFDVVTGALGSVLGEMVVGGWRGYRRRWWPWRRSRSAGQSATVAADAVPPNGMVVLQSGQLLAFRQACLEHGMALGLPEVKARVLADAALGALVPLTEAPPAAEDGRSAGASE